MLQATAKVKRSQRLNLPSLTRYVGIGSSASQSFFSQLMWRPPNLVPAPLCMVIRFVGFCPQRLNPQRACRGRSILGCPGSINP